MPSQHQGIRLRRRLVRHHLPLLAICLGVCASVYVTRPYRDVVSRLSFATAYPALGLLAATLLIGPWRLLRKRRNPVSDDLRRDVGIWAGALGALHSAVGQCVHLRGRPWLYYVYGPGRHHAFPLRHDLFGLANYTGAFATLLLLALLATSNDLSLRTMGTPRWKQLQRWNYAVFTLVAIHAFAFQASEKQKFPFVLAAAFGVGVTGIVQVLGVLSRRQGAAALRTRLQR